MLALVGTGRHNSSTFLPPGKHTNICSCTSTFASLHEVEEMRDLISQKHLQFTTPPPPFRFYFYFRQYATVALPTILAGTVGYLALRSDTISA